MRNQMVRVRCLRAIVAATGTLAVWSVSCVLLMPPAWAVTLTNKDSAAYKIEVILKEKRSQHELAPGKAMADFCKDGCVIRLNGSDANDYELEGTERISIEGGLVYYDGEEIKKAGDDASESATPAQ